jgi:hypothetical protein
MGILVPTLYQEDFALESLLGSKLQICCLRKCDRTGANEDKDKDKDQLERARWKFSVFSLLVKVYTFASSV